MDHPMRGAGVIAASQKQEGGKGVLQNAGFDQRRLGGGDAESGIQAERIRGEWGRLIRHLGSQHGLNLGDPCGLYRHVGYSAT
jgi:hypothetical protein